MIRPPMSTASSCCTGLALQSLQKVQLGISPVELVYTAHEQWPCRPGQAINTRPTLRISVLDSSFNPPTLAHLALANSLPPSSFQTTPFPHAEPYDAQLLLLSVRNADKVLKLGDATFFQRLEMMHLLSYDIHSTMNAESGSDSEFSRFGGNVAVAVINEPTFVGKSAVLLRFLQTRLAIAVRPRLGISVGQDNFFPSPKLTFLLGFDTFVRLFSPTYYPSAKAMVQMLQTFLSPDQEDCRIVCAYRKSISADSEKALEVAHEFITSDRIAFIDIGAEEQTYSSSEVRTKVIARDWKWMHLVPKAVAEYVIEQGIYAGLEREQ